MENVYENVYVYFIGNVHENVYVYLTRNVYENVYYRENVYSFQWNGI